MHRFVIYFSMTESFLLFSSCFFLRNHDDGILTVEGITRHAKKQTNKHFILRHVPHPPLLARSSLLDSQIVEKGWLLTCCLNLIKNSPFSQKSFSF